MVLLHLLLLLLNISRSLLKSVSSNMSEVREESNFKSGIESGEIEYADATIIRQKFTLTSHGCTGFECVCSVYDPDTPTTINHYHNLLDVFWPVN
jgi:hypothetical protein